MRSIRFSVNGKPIPKGSHTAFMVGWPNQNWSAGKRNAALQRLAESIRMGRYPQITMTHNNSKQLKKWEKKVADRAILALRDSGDSAMLTGAIIVQVKFYIQRPQNHYVNNNNGPDHDRDRYGNRPLKANYEKLWPLQDPDTDKMMRSINDAIQGVLFKDDNQVVGCIPFKFWNSREGVSIVVREVGDMNGTGRQFDIDSIAEKMIQPSLEGL